MLRGTSYCCLNRISEKNHIKPGEDKLPESCQSAGCVTAEMLVLESYQRDRAPGGLIFCAKLMFQVHGTGPPSWRGALGGHKGPDTSRDTVVFLGERGWMEGTDLYLHSEAALNSTEI